jgi:Transposase, Mutator family
VLASAHEQSVPIFQQLARGHPSGRDDVRAIPTVASETSKISWPSAGSTSATRPFGSGGTGLARCLPPRFVSPRGLSAGDFQEALTALFGKDAPNVSPAVIARLKGEWEGEYRRWLQRDLSARRYVYVWADGVYLQARMEPQAECMLVLTGATPEGEKELVGFQTGQRESAQSWKELLVEMKARGLASAPEVAVGDGALGFWKALDEAFPSTRHQRCWVHAAAEAAIDVFAAKYAPKYRNAVDRTVR